MNPPLLEVERLSRRFGGLVASDSVDLVVMPGEIHAVIGPNGAGKSTLINLLTGELAPDEGAIRFLGRDITRDPVHARALAGISRSYQITSVIPEFSAIENVALAVQARAGHSFAFWRPVSQDPALFEPARRALDLVGLSGRARLPAAQFAHGERRQLELAMALAGSPKLLLLDEPMAGMSLGESESMIRLLAGLKGRHAMLLVEHDMDAVFALADRITVLVYGRVIACDTPSAIRANPAVRSAYLGDDGADA